MSIDLYSEDLLAVDENGFERSDDEDDPHEIEEVIEGQLEPVGDEDGDEGPATSGTQTKKPKKERVIKNPQPKLNAQRLKGPRGIASLSSYFKDFKFHGDGHEKEDLDRLMQRMEHWAHRLYPRLTFNDFLARVEKLGQKPEMKTYIRRVRLGMVDEPVIDDDEDNANNDRPMEIEDPDDPPPDVFDDLLGPQFQPQTLPPPRTLSPPITLTDKQLERMRVNRQLAIDKRLAKQKALEQIEQSSSEQDASIENDIPLNEVVSPKSFPKFLNDELAILND